MVKVVLSCHQSNGRSEGDRPLPTAEHPLPKHGKVQQSQLQNGLRPTKTTGIQEFGERILQIQEQVNNKKQVFVLHFACFFVTLTLKKAKLLHLGRKNKQVYFVLLSIIRNFAARKERLIMQETRQAKISRLLQKELAQIFQSQTRMMHGVMVSVTRVKISPDLSICTAHLSVFPSEKAEEILNNVNANVKTIRYDLGQRIRNQVRIIPELRFFIDDSLDYIDHIDELLKK
jgi:ribosome-binding factor A